MKKYYYIAAALLAAAACAREQIIPEEPEVEQSGPIDVTLVAGEPETRTELGSVDGALKPFWSAGDAISVVWIPGPEDENSFEMDPVFSDYYWYHPFASDLSDRNLSARFTGTVNKTGQYRAFYPAAEWVQEVYDDEVYEYLEGPCLDRYYVYDYDTGSGQEYPSIRFTIPPIQNPSATSFDPKADLLISAPFEVASQGSAGLGSSSGDIPICFTRVNAIVKLKFNVTGDLVETLQGEKVRMVALGNYYGDEKSMKAPAQTRASYVDNDGSRHGLTGEMNYLLSYADDPEDFDANVDDRYVSPDEWRDFAVAQYTDETAYNIINPSNPESATYLIVAPSILKNTMVEVYDDNIGDLVMTDEVEDGLPIQIETEDYVIRRNITLPSDGIALQPSAVTTLNVSLTKDNAEVIARGIAFEKSETTLIPGDGEFVDLNIIELSLPEIGSNVDFQRHFAVSARAVDSNQPVSGFSFSFIPSYDEEEEHSNYPYTEIESDYISNLYLGVPRGVEAGEYDVTITLDGKYSATCRVTIITESKSIVFADPKVKRICVDTWGGHLIDEELTEYEASKVTTLINTEDYESYFNGDTEITSFDELQYFTGLTSIDHSAFAGCSSLQSIKLPKSVTVIGNLNYGSSYAFFNCTSLASVDLSECTALERIESYAFANCTSLTAITLPASVKSISEDAFRYCTKLQTVTIPANSQLQRLYGDYYYNQMVASYEHGVFYGCQALQSIWLPPTLEMIGEYAFKGCSNLSSITIPESVTSIGDSAFRDCSSLEHISIPGSISTISADAFHGCTNLSEVILHDGLHTIGSRAFMTCSNLHQIVLPATVNQLGTGMYSYYEGLVFENVEFRSGLGEDGVEYHGVKFLGSTPPYIKNTDITISGKHWDADANDGAGGWVDGIDVYVPSGSKAAYEALNNVTNGGQNTIIEF